MKGNARGGQVGSDVTIVGKRQDAHRSRQLREEVAVLDPSFARLFVMPCRSQVASQAMNEDEAEARR